MKTELDVRETAQMLLWAAEKMIGQERRFCELDSGIGDGDHGVTISRGFRAAREALLVPVKNLEELFLEVGDRMGSAMGGAVGPIYSMIFEGFAQAVRGRDSIDAAAAAEMLKRAAEEVRAGAGVREGQKTLFDALAPAAAAANEAAQRGEALDGVLAAGAKAAADGARLTADMTAAKGRARFLREKSVGYMDAGAASTAVFLEALHEYAAQ